MQTSQGRQLEARLVAAAARKEALEQEYLVKKKTLEMLPDATENLRKLQGICAESAKKLMELGAEWEQHRRPLIAEQRHLVESRGQRKDRCRQKVRTRVSADGRVGGGVVVEVVLCRGVGVMQELFAVLTVVCSVVGDEWRPVCESAHTWA